LAVKRLRGKIAMITGGARGMGAAHGTIFAREGASVLLLDILDREGEALAAELRNSTFDVRYMRLDVSSPTDWDAAVALVETRWGKLNILVNNAGIVGTKNALDVETETDWQQVTDVNQRGVWLGMQACVPAMRRAGGGSIVNISSMNGVVGLPGYFSYQASKGAVRMMTKSAALSYAADNIRVNTVCPGVVLTPMAEEDGDAMNTALIAATPLRRAAHPEEVSWGVLFLASDEASFITGTELIIDGGYTAQ
jgi:NAD(P)-dependent dehydrogenase (short-subunit alcohol dehydrogenase family)